MRTASIDWASRMDITTAPLSAEQASGVAFFRALKLPPSAPMPDAVSRLLVLGSPHLALARARGVPFGPMILSLPVAIARGGRSGIGADISSAVQVPTIVSQIAVRIVSDEPELTDMDFDGNMKVEGHPRYAVSHGYVRLDSLVRVVNSMPDSWILTKGQQITMLVRSNRRLRTAVTVYFALRCWQPLLEPEHELWKLSKHEVLEALEAAGYDMPEALWSVTKEMR